jgi:hypothetical protein
MNRARFTFLVICAASVTAFAAFSPSAVSIDLRFVGASEAYKAIEDRLGADAASAIRDIDLRRNALSVDSSHPQAARVREFLASFDRRPAQVMVDAVVTHRIEATADAPAREEVLSRWSVFGRADQPITLKIPGEGATTNIELQITSIPAQQ